MVEVETRRAWMLQPGRRQRSCTAAGSQLCITSCRITGLTELPIQVEIAPQSSVARHRLWLKIGAAVLLGGIVSVAIASWYAGRLVRRHLVDALESHYHSKVELQDFTVLVFPRVRISGDGLVLRQDPDPSAPPFIKVAKFSTDASILDLLRRKKRIASVTLQGLEIHIAHGRQIEPNASSGERPRKVPEFVIGELTAGDAKLIIHPSEPGKNPLEFDIHHLSLRSAGTGENMKYKATLTNPTPPGKIESTGYFGPFNVDDPGKSPLHGDYTFRDADLAHFKGIAGILSSDGSFSGVLERIDVKGKTDVPNFTVGDSGHPVHLTADFTATVDGTDGDTYLHDVRAHFLDTSLVASGKVEGHAGQHGKTVTLKVEAEKARIEDLLTLVDKSSNPPLRGEGEFHTQFELPPGDASVIDRLRLNGAFGIEDAKFASNSIQDKIAKLSARARGNHSDNFVPGNTASDLAGHFTLENGRARFSQLSFLVPGATVDLHGTYNLDSQSLDFHGNLHMQAELSQMTTGIKSFFAKLAQPLFRGKNGKDKTDIPIKVTGTRSDPKFGLDAAQVFH